MILFNEHRTALCIHVFGIRICVSILTTKCSFACYDEGEVSQGRDLEGKTPMTNTGP